MTPIPQASAMPAFAPLFAVGREEVDVEWMTIVYPTDPEMLRRVLPAPLRLGEEPEVGVWMALFKNAAFLSKAGGVETRPAYWQAGVSVRCAREDVEGAYALCTYVEGLNHGILGRELFGLPKKQVRRASFAREGGKAALGIDLASGHRLLRADVRFDPGTGTGAPAPNWFEQHFTLKLIPSAEGDGFDVSRLVEIPWRFTESRELLAGSAELRWQEIPSDPLHLLDVRGEARVRYGESRLGIDFGVYREDVTAFESFGVPSW